MRDGAFRVPRAMKLAVLHVLRSNRGRHGGPPVVANAIIEQLHQDGHKVSMVVSTTGDDSVRTDATVVSFLHQVLGILFSRGLLVRLVSEADVVHIHCLWNALHLSVGIIARRQGIPYVISPHGTLDPWSLRQSPRRKRWALRLGFRKLLHHAAALHVLNDAEASLIAPLKLEVPTIVIPNGVKLADIRHGGRQEDDESGQRPRTPILLFLGRIHHKKGLDIVIRAMPSVRERYPCTTLLVVGPDDGDQDRVKALATDLGVDDAVRFLGPRFGIDKDQLMAAATLFLLPSRQEGSPMAVLEAMACGLPSIVSRACHLSAAAMVGAVVELPGEEVYHRDLAEEIVALLNDRQRRVEIGLAASAWVNEHGTWESIVSGRFIPLYQEISVSGLSHSSPIE